MKLSDTHYTAKQVKDLLGISGPTLMRWKKEGKIRVKQISQRKVWYLKEDVDKLLL